MALKTDYSAQEVIDLLRDLHPVAEGSMSTSMGAALVNEIDRLHDELDRMRMMFLECWVCNCALAAPTRHWIPPHCSDCIVTEEVTQLWEEWFSKHGAKK